MACQNYRKMTEDQFKELLKIPGQARATETEESILLKEQLLLPY